MNKLVILGVLVVLWYFTMGPGASSEPTVTPAGPAGDQDPDTPVVVPAGDVPPETPVWTIMEGKDYRGNDIMCGKHSTLKSIQTACLADSRCKGFSFRNGKPWCMKHAVPVQVSDRTHTFHMRN